MPRIEPTPVDPIKEENRKEVRKVPGIPQEQFDKMVEETAAAEKKRIETAIKSPVDKQLSPQLSPEAGMSEKFKYSIKYHPLSGKRIVGIPEELHYRPIDGLMIATINEMNTDELDDMINYVLDNLCYESKFEGFTHWLMPNPEKIRAYLNLRINTVGEVIETVTAFCSECGKNKLILKLNLLTFEEDEIKERYKEPFPLKATLKTPGGDKIVRFLSRLIQSGDMKKARTIYEKDKKFIAEVFPGVDEKRKDIVIQLLEYANTIISVDGSPVKYEDALNLCKDNASIIDAITSFNNHFMFGLKMEKPDTCDNPECPSYSKKEIEVIDKSSRGPLRSENQESTAPTNFLIPVQPALFYILKTPERSVEFFDDN